VNAIITHDDLGAVVRVWLFNDTPEGRIYMWPMGYPDPKHKAMTWMQEIVAHNMVVPDTIRPALEFPRHMWDAFKEALLADAHLRVDALDIVAKTLDREQNRVDALIHALIKGLEPSYLISTGEKI
jgi:hypothetical protein